MNHASITLLFVVIALSFSCTSDSTNHQDQQQEISFDQAHPPLAKDTFQSVSYNIHSLPLSILDSTPILAPYTIYHEMVHSYFVFFNKKNGKIQFLEIATHDIPYQSVANYDLEIQKYGGVDHLYVHNLDSIFFLQTYRIALGNLKGVYKTILTNSLDTLDYRVVKDPTNLFFPLYYADGGIYVPTYCTDASDSLYEPGTNYYTEPIESFLSMEGERQNLDFPTHPNRYKNNFYGLVRNASRTHDKASHVYSFRADPFLTIWNKHTHKIDRVPARSRYQTEEIEPLNLNKDSVRGLSYMERFQVRMDHMNTKGQYIYTRYDPYRKLYHRFFMIPQPKQFEDGTFSSFKDYQVALMVLNEDFELKKELLLPDEYRRRIFQVTQTGLFTQMGRDSANYNFLTITFD